MRRKDIASVALLLCVLAAWSCTRRHDFFAVVIDTASKKPVPSARLILAPKKEGKYECTIDTSLTGVSNDRGEVRIPNVAPGEYVVFYNLSASLNPGLNGKVVNYDPARQGLPGPNQGQVELALIESLGPFEAMAGSKIAIFESQLVVFSGWLYWPGLDIGAIKANGELLKLHIPSAGSAPVTIEVNTDLPSPNPPQGAPKSGR